MTEEGWRKETLSLRKLRIEEAAAMNEFVKMFEARENGEGDGLLLCLALHHVAMMMGCVGAGKTTLKRALKSGGIEELSRVAPAIYPPDRVPKKWRQRK
jgi:hypothetical protein